VSKVTQELRITCSVYLHERYRFPQYWTLHEISISAFPSMSDLIDGVTNHYV